MPNYTMECPECEHVEKIVRFGMPRVHECEECGQRYNIVTRPMRIRLDADDDVEMQASFNEFYNVGTYLTNKFKKWFDEREPILQEEAVCASCEKEIKPKRKQSKILVWKGKTDNSKVCPTCFLKEFLDGKRAYREVRQEYHKGAEMINSNVVEMAKSIAISHIKAWYDNNFSAFVSLADTRRELAKCKEKVQKKEDIEHEVEMIEGLRRGWYNNNRLQSPYNYFKWWWINDYRSGRDRRKGLKKLGKKYEIADIVAEPVCGDCEEKVVKKGDRLCGIEKNRRKVSRFPKFTKTKMKVNKDNLKNIEWKVDFCINMNLISFNNEFKGKGNKWIPARYDVEAINPTRYPTIYKKNKGNKEIYVMDYPSREFIPLNDTGWVHVIVPGAGKTVVVSEDGNEKKVKFFRHGKQKYIKEHYEAKRKVMKTGEKESNKLEAIAHNVSKQIANYLKEYGGKAVIVNPQKKELKEVMKSKDYNKKLKLWTSNSLRAKLMYKLMLEGVEIIGGNNKTPFKSFNLTEVVKCSKCGDEQVGSYQNYYLEGMKSVKCCGEENIYLNIANHVMLNQTSTTEGAK